MTDQQPSSSPAPRFPAGDGVRPDPFGLVPIDDEMTALRKLVADAAHQHAPECDCGCGDKADMSAMVNAIMREVGPVIARLRHQVRQSQTSSTFAERTDR